ncbi:uncharacterized protein LOC119086569 [Peromyscus leucopus]|uniref:uncharacterized protein LOC119086569 n=1 Tax=Peromyscus leucopus TaxID=10041 RepID=UPI001885976F|nr:uncharacterized protein LOC119086569 [Peromyscus leucopus]
MGNKTSKVDTPLNCVLDNFDELYTRSVKKCYKYRITKKRLRNFCQYIWPTFEVRWPSRGTFDPQVAWAVVDFARRLPGELNQIGYILPWAEATSNPPPWMKDYMVRNGLPHSPSPHLPQPPPQPKPVTRPPPQPKPVTHTPPQPKPVTHTPPQPKPVTHTPPQPKPVTHTPPQPKPVTHTPPQPKPVTRPPPQPKPVTHTPPQPKPVTHTPPQPKPVTHTPPQPTPVTRPPPQPKPVTHTPPQPKPVTPPPPQPPPQALPPPSDACVPFTSTDLYNQNIQNLPFSTTQSYIAYEPLTTRDLLNWKVQCPPFSTDPKPLISLIEMIFLIHRPTWDECQIILYILFTKWEREKILKDAAKELCGMDALPTQRPDWNYRTEEGRRFLSDYHQALLKRLKRAARKPTDFSKVTDTKQGPKEPPAAFLERLLEAYRDYTSIDPDDPANRFTVNLSFAAQSSPDIRKEIQSMDRFFEMSRLELLQVAQEVFDNREMEKQIELFKHVIYGQHSFGSFSPGQTTYNRRGRPLRRDQCAYCKELGHWKHECPKQRWVGPPWPRPRLALGE